MFSALSVVSVIQRFWNVGLVPLLSDFLAFYRKAFYSFFDFLPFSLPGWYKDAFILSSVFTAIAIRAIISNSQGGFQKYEDLRLIAYFVLGIWWLLFSTLLLGPLFAVLLYILGMVTPDRNSDFEGTSYEEERAASLEFANAILFSFVALIVASVAFFVLNANL